MKDFRLFDVYCLLTAIAYAIMGSWFATRSISTIVQSTTVTSILFLIIGGLKLTLIECLHRPQASGFLYVMEITVTLVATSGIGSIRDRTRQIVKHENILYSQLYTNSNWIDLQQQFNCCGWNQTSGPLATGLTCFNTNTTCRLPVLAELQYTVNLIFYCSIVLVITAYIVTTIKLTMLYTHYVLSSPIEYNEL